MRQDEIQQFLERYFCANDCDIIENEDGYITVQLTVAMDKELMNRPFYWHYIERTGGTPAPMQLTLITKQNEKTKTLNGEQLHFGSPRLHQIFQSAQRHGSYIRLYEEANASVQSSVPLHPWLGINAKISYQCDRKKDTILSLGLHLITGTIVEQFHEKLQKLPLTPKIPDYCFTISPIIKPQSGMARLEQYIGKKIEQDDHTWAEQAIARWNEDLALLDHFYEEMEEKPECYYMEKQALEEQYKPKITISIINGGLFYLQQRP
ncbi:YqhG family protein [Anoxybacillus sp. J5B_2022]|uniref:YqhG family protein n=1 Tax=Anoxybacillus sp. J5B_2022 TaxID=3003246 RepID=UPI0022868F35|nr:YqhG family protein [Anoxybacillus sp. J5B_2022]MCZ0754645.1 YqhG family protein [Anoxybacillus sp. J5B_2022]